jgi:hypothetical protein
MNPFKKPQPVVASSWELSEVRDNVTFTGDRMIAWYLASEQTYSFRTVREIEDLIRNQASQLAKLVGNTIHVRVTTRPYPVAHWARAAWENAPDPQPGFAQMLERDQRHMARSAQADKLVYYGVDLGARSTAVKLLSRFVPAAAERELEALDSRRAEVDKIMSGPGFDARPAYGKTLQWLIARSLALGCPVPVPDPQEDEELHLDGAALSDWISSVHWDAEPLAPTVRVTTSLTGGQQITRHVCVLTVSRIADIAVPEAHVPWMTKTDEVDFGVEWSCRIKPRSPEEVSKEMSSITRRIDGQVSHWSEDHGKRPPKQLARQADRAADVEDEMRSEFTGLSTRTAGWYRIAVSGRTEREALDRAQHLIRLYGPQITIVRPLGQYHLAREFVPGERLASEAHARNFPVLKAAAGLPMVTAKVGDRRGFHIGETATMSRRAVLVDLHVLPEIVEAGALVPMVGSPGSGKSTLMGLITAKSILSGVTGVLMDPAGKLQRLLTLPEIGGGIVDGQEVKPLARSVDVLNGRAGSLSPYAVVPEPTMAMIMADLPRGTDPEELLQQERAAAVQTRRDLTMMALRWCLPLALARSDEAQMRLLHAVNSCPATRSSTPRAVLETLHGGDAEDQRIARMLENASETHLGRLLFPTDTGALDADIAAAPRFTFFNLKGLLVPPAEVPMEEWRQEELLARPVMTLAAWSALNLIYRGDPSERKLFGLDEVQEITTVAGGTGRALVYKLSSDARKNNLVTLLSTQNASTVLGQDVNNFVGACFVGRTQTEDAQRDALKLLGKPAGAGYEDVLAGLSAQQLGGEDIAYREFVYRDGLGGADGTGGMERIRVTLDHHPELKAALDTTPAPEKRLKALQALEDPTASFLKASRSEGVA